MKSQRHIIMARSWKENSASNLKDLCKPLYKAVQSSFWADNAEIDG